MQLKFTNNIEKIMYTKKTFLKFHYTDTAGILFFSNIFIIAHDVYEEMMNKIGFRLNDIVEKEDFLLPLVHSEADYKIPLKAGDEFTINAGISRMGNSSYTISYSILKEGEIAATVETVMVAMDKKSGTKIAVPEKLREGLGKYLAGAF